MFKKRLLVWILCQTVRHYNTKQEGKTTTQQKKAKAFLFTGRYYWLEFYLQVKLIYKKQNNEQTLIQKIYES